VTHLSVAAHHQLTPHPPPSTSTHLSHPLHAHTQVEHARNRAVRDAASLLKTLQTLHTTLEDAELTKEQRRQQRDGTERARRMIERSAGAAMTARPTLVLSTEDSKALVEAETALATGITKFHTGDFAGAEGHLEACEEVFRRLQNLPLLLTVRGPPSGCYAG
jgi:hypothetical protein